MLRSVWPKTLAGTRNRMPVVEKLNIVATG